MQVETFVASIGFMYTTRRRGGDVNAALGAKGEQGMGEDIAWMKGGGRKGGLLCADVGRACLSPDSGGCIYFSSAQQTLPLLSTFAVPYLAV